MAKIDFCQPKVVGTGFVILFEYCSSSHMFLFQLQLQILAEFGRLLLYKN
jgi:hypothetical protein